MNYKSKKIYHLGKLSIALLENFLKKYVGDDFVNELRKPLMDKELRNALKNALKVSEERFVTTYSNKEISRLLLELPMPDLPSVAESLFRYVSRPTDTSFEELIIFHLKAVVSFKYSDEEITNVVKCYTKILREELVVTVPSARESILGLATLSTEQNIKDIKDLLKAISDRENNQKIISKSSKADARLPLLPKLVVGREDDLSNLKERLLIRKDKKIGIRGWPGVGKTTFVSLLANNVEIGQYFSEGILWVSLGDKFTDHYSKLISWCKTLGVEVPSDETKNLDRVKKLLQERISEKNLIIIDDLWKLDDALPFLAVSQNSTIVFTTRFLGVAQNLLDNPEQIYLLNTLNIDDALDLLRKISPLVAENFPKESEILVKSLEGLPLAIQVAGRLLNNEAKLGWGIYELLQDISQGSSLLNATVPPDRIDLETQTLPTVAALLQKSVNLLDEVSYERFALLGAFAPKPATFDIKAISVLWGVSDAKPTIRILVDRGLLEAFGDGNFQMHALLTMLAESLLE